jgi:hypothetical protein
MNLIRHQISKICRRATPRTVFTDAALQAASPRRRRHSALGRTKSATMRWSWPAPAKSSRSTRGASRKRGPTCSSFPTPWSEAPGYSDPAAPRRTTASSNSASWTTASEDGVARRIDSDEPTSRRSSSTLRTAISARRRKFAMRTCPCCRSDVEQETDEKLSRIGIPLGGLGSRLRTRNRETTRGRDHAE